MPLQKASLQRLIEASPDIVIATDAGGTVAYYNDGAEGTLGYSRDEIIGESVVKLYPSRDEAKRVMAAMREPSEGGKGRVLNFETVFVAKDGSEIACAISGVILYGEAGQEEGTIGFSKDLREFKHRDQLAVLGEVAVGLSHEINNPLETIANQVALLESYLREVAPEVEQSRIRSIRSEIKRIEAHLMRLAEMSEREEYASTDYIGDARMVDLSEREDAAQGNPLAGKHVLVVDDDQPVRDSVADLLRLEGCVVDTADDGKRALEMVESAPYDLVLSDVVMPRMDGYELYQALRELRPDTEVCLMTAFYYDKDHIIKRSRMQGLEGVLFKKPIDPDRLRDVLGKLVSGSA